MPLPPQKFREAVFQLLYSFDFLCENGEETGSMLMAELKITKKSVSQAQELAEKIYAKVVDNRLKKNTHLQQKTPKKIEEKYQRLRALYKDYKVLKPYRKDKL